MKRGVPLVCATFTMLAVVTPAAAQTGSSLEAGGLRPPEAVQADPSPTPRTQTEAALDRADREDSGRGLEFAWLNAEVGPEVLGLQTLKSKALVDGQLLDTTGTGMSYGAGIGLRLLVFTVGARFRFANFSDWQLWTLGAEAGMHIPLGRLEPYFSLGAGYASLGGFDAARFEVVPNNAHGLNLRGGVGLDVYLTNSFSVGGNLSGEFLFLSRGASSPPNVPAATSAEQQHANAVYQVDGSGIGAGATLSAVLGLHF